MRPDIILRTLITVRWLHNRWCNSILRTGLGPGCYRFSTLTFCEWHSRKKLLVSRILAHNSRWFVHWWSMACVFLYPPPPPPPPYFQLYASMNWDIRSSSNGLSPVWRQAQTLTGNPIGNCRCQLLASRALKMSCYISQSARSIESSCVVNYIYGPSD